MSTYEYEPAEIAYLVSLSEQEAREADTAIPDSWGLVEQLDGGDPSTSDHDLPTIVRWWDVQRAKSAAERQVSTEALELRARGLSGDEAAVVLGMSSRNVRRQVRSATSAILTELGTPPRRRDPQEALAVLLARATRPV